MMIKVKRIPEVIFTVPIADISPLIYLSPKKAGVAKKSHQKMDRERREAEAKEAEKKIKEAAENTSETADEAPASGGLFANIKGGDELLKKLKGEQ